MLTQKSQKSPIIFLCKKCDYNTCKNSDFKKHILTSKHQNVDKMLTNVDALATKVAKKSYSCNCGKEYKHRQSLYVHKKICKFEEETPEKNNNIIHPEDYSDKDQLIMMLIKQNYEITKDNNDIKTMMMKVIENGTNNNNTNHSYNKTFNLQFFLNETCKDAMNIMDFVESIKLQLSDLEKVGEIGFVDGISNIITNNLKALDITQRPIHCADKKREILYIKDENKWEKENDEKHKLRKAIKKVVSKNQRLLSIYKQQHPDCVKSTSIYSDQYNKMIIESMGGFGNNDLEKEDKIIKNISKQVTIDKNLY
jgi:hypothetical protein